MKDVWVGAEASMPDGDSPLVAQRGCDQTVMQLVDHKAAKRQSAAGGAGFDAAQDADTGYCTQAFEHPAAERHLVFEHLVKPQLEKGLDRDPERHCADDVGRAGLFSVPQIGPDGVVPRHDADGASTPDLRCACAQVTWRA